MPEPAAVVGADETGRTTIDLAHPDFSQDQHGAFAAARARVLFESHVWSPATRAIHQR